MDKPESDKHSPTVDPNVTKACSGSGAMDWKQFFWEMSSADRIERSRGGVDEKS